MNSGVKEVPLARMYVCCVLLLSSLIFPFVGYENWFGKPDVQPAVRALVLFLMQSECLFQAKASEGFLFVL